MYDIIIKTEEINMKIAHLPLALRFMTMQKWKVDNNSISIQNSIFNPIACDLSAFGGLPQNEKLTIEDFKYYLKISGRELKDIKLIQRTILCGQGRNKKEIDIVVKREFPLDTKLKDGSILIDNLENFEWSFNWEEMALSGLHYLPPRAYVEINAVPSKRLLGYIAKRPISEKEVITMTHDLNTYKEMEAVKTEMFKHTKQQPEKIKE